MNVVYRHYEPNQGLEELQARIYTEVSGLTATADQVRTSISNRDPQNIRYALTDDGEPLAYVQAVRSGSHPGRVNISYPWALPECPADVQEKIFDELLSYVQEREKPVEIASSFVVRSKIANKQVEFYKKKGFTEKERIYWYYSDFDMVETSKHEIPDNLRSFTSRLATNDDIDLLIDLCKVDQELQSAFRTREAAVAYFRDRVLKDGHLVLLLEDELPVAAAAPLRIQPGHPLFDWEEERIIMRFSAIRPGYDEVMQRLLIEIAKECLTAGWSNVPLRMHFYFRANSKSAITLAGMKEGIQAFEIVFSKITNSD